MRWRQYLLGQKFVMRTGQQSLRNLLYQVAQTPEQHTYLIKLLGFDFKVHYKLGKDNVVVDVFSR